jgi:hypothetical protein
VVFVDAAKAMGEPGQDAARKFDWGNKLRFMLTTAEIKRLAAVAVGKVRSIKFDNHGDDSNKWMSVEHQGPNLFIKVGQASTMYAVPADDDATFNLAALLISQIEKNSPAGAKHYIQGLLSGVTAAMLNAQQEKQGARRNAA